MDGLLCECKGDMVQLDTRTLIVIHSHTHTHTHTLVCDGATRQLLLLLEFLKLVDLICGLFVGMDSAITKLVNDRKLCKHSIQALTSSMPRRLSL
jgi:hypothetical protein